jgi:hypothetical protein
MAIAGWAKRAWAGQGDALGLGASLQANPSLGMIIFDGITEQVLDHLGHQVAIAPGGDSRGYLPVHLQVRGQQ